MEIVKEIDMFEENEKHELKIIQCPVEFEDEEVDVSKINFSSPETLEFAAKSLVDLKVVNV